LKFIYVVLLDITNICIDGSTFFCLLYFCTCHENDCNFCRRR